MCSSDLIRVPGMTNGKTNSIITEFIDIYPTLCELSGLPLPDHLEGESLVKRLKRPERNKKDFAVSKFNNGLTLIEEDLFYTEWLNKNDSTVANMLYDHSSDPDENINLAAKAEYAGITSLLGKKLKEKRGAAFRKIEKD